MSIIREGPADPSLFLATAIEAVRRAGRMQLDAVGTGFTVRKKGVIDLVTEVDLAIERAFRELVAERHPDHDVLGEELGAPPTTRPGARHLWIFDPIDGTTSCTRPSAGEAPG
jgi:myo-inositol-1(or 4)-monophosphatase